MVVPVTPRSGTTPKERIVNESNIDWILAIACFLAGIGIGALCYHLLNANVARNQKVRQRLAETELELNQVRDSLNDISPRSPISPPASSARARSSRAIWYMAPIAWSTTCSSSADCMARARKRTPTSMYLRFRGTTPTATAVHCPRTTACARSAKRKRTSASRRATESTLASLPPAPRQAAARPLLPPRALSPPRPLR